MTELPDPSRGRTLIRRVMFPVRRVVAPAALELHEQVQTMAAEIDRLRVELVRQAGRAEALEVRLATLTARTDDMGNDIAESRALNLRVAELTDVVTELVLPLHDRELDRSALQNLRPDTL